MNRRVHDIIATTLAAMFAVYVSERDNLDELKARRRREAERKKAVLECLRRASGRTMDNAANHDSITQEGRTPSNPTHDKGRKEIAPCRAQ